jgi:hypothetical protein
MVRGAGAKAEPPAAASSATRAETPTRRSLRAALLVTALVLVLTADERYFGLVPDGRIMVRTAVSMITLGEIGIARGQAFALERPGGDSVTRYGIGPSLTLSVPTFFAGFFERAFKRGTSQTLYILHQILFLLAAAAGAGALARAWGGDGRAVSRSALAAVVGSPLLAYAGSDFSEPLQAALLAVAFAAAASAVACDTAPRRALLLAAAAGGAAGFAVLSKPVFILALPIVFALVALDGPATGRLARGGAALVGWFPFAGLWLAFEISRFGRPFASYAGNRFSHPPLDGLFRLTIGPNKGLLLYFPLVVLSLVGLPLLFRRSRLAAISVALFAGAILLSSAAWWAWDGTFGWGPRLLVPLLPLLAVLAALGAGRFPPIVFRLLFGLSVVVNLIGVLQPDIDTMKYFSILPRRVLSAVDVARYPYFTYDREAATGGGRLDNQFWVAEVPALSPLRVASWLLFNRLRGGDVLSRLRTPPWTADRPELRVETPLETALPADQLAHFSRPFAWPHLGMSFFRRKSDVSWGAAWTEGILDQAVRAQDMRRADRAVDFGERLWRNLANPQTAVVLAESYRIAGRREALEELTARVRARRPVDSRFPLVLALHSRDGGDIASARSLVEASLAIEERPGVRKLLEIPLAEWPATLRDVTGENRTPRTRPE